DDAQLEAELLARVRDAVDGAGLFASLGSDWVLLDCELMPWSAKAQELLRQQYAAVGAAASAGLHGTVEALSAAARRRVDVAELVGRFSSREADARAFVEAYRRYCWPVSSLA